jgi:hypothetical protein
VPEVTSDSETSNSDLLTTWPEQHILTLEYIISQQFSTAWMHIYNFLCLFCHTGADLVVGLFTIKAVLANAYKENLQLHKVGDLRSYWPVIPGKSKK